MSICFACNKKVDKTNRLKLAYLSANVDMYKLCDECTLNLIKLLCVQSPTDVKRGIALLSSGVTVKNDI